MIGKINEDLVRERKKCTFDINELINLIDGGKNNTQQRKLFEEKIFSVKVLKDDVPEEYLSYKERYENSVRKACIYASIARDHYLRGTAITDYKPTNIYRSYSGVIKDVTPFYVHTGMFVPAILGQASPEQQAVWLPKALLMEMIGTYAQTELGHGTFVRGLETTATYDPKTEEFVLNSPTLTSYKWWPGGLAHTANHCILVAQLYTNGKCYGVHPFLVQLRDMETHMPLPGIKVGEIGPKLGFQTANNGFLGFENYRIPRMNMLMKNSQVLKDGTFVKLENEKLTYGTMVFVRVTIVTDVAYYLSRAATVAVRYSAVRHQSQPKPGQPEPQIIDYVTQQHKLFIAIATSHAFRIAGMWLWDSYETFTQNMKEGKLEQLPELHALSCCLKALSSTDAALLVEQCRLACGGHGFMTSSSLPVIYGLTTATATYEGEYTVMQLQTARYLVKAWRQAMEGKVMTPTVAHLVNFHKNNKSKWENSPEGIIKGFQAVAAGKIKVACETLQRHVESGKELENAWNLASVQLVSASEAHCRLVLCEVFWGETKRLTASVSPALAVVLKQLAELYLIHWALEKSGNLLLYSPVCNTDILALQERYEQLLALIRPNAVGLVDAFDIRDEILNSTLGAYDGNVYERLMEEALKSPLNKEPVNESFHKYIKPFVERAKL